jgi:hypothetical protein
MSQEDSGCFYLGYFIQVNVASGETELFVGLNHHYDNERENLNGIGYLFSFSNNGEVGGLTYYCEVGQIVNLSIAGFGVNEFQIQVLDTEPIIAIKEGTFTSTGSGSLLNGIFFQQGSEYSVVVDRSPSFRHAIDQTEAVQSYKSAKQD